jgi:hypothetical protein
LPQVFSFSDNEKTVTFQNGAATNDCCACDERRRFSPYAKSLRPGKKWPAFPILKATPETFTALFHDASHGYCKVINSHFTFVGKYHKEVPSTAMSPETA